MQWDIINTEPIVPKCSFCDKTTDQMARFHLSEGHGITSYICSSCARYVKDAMNKWIEVKSTDWIDTGSVFNSKYIDTAISAEKQQ